MCFKFRKKCYFGGWLKIQLFWHFFSNAVAPNRAWSVKKMLKTLILVHWAMQYFTIFRAWCKKERFARPQSEGLYQLFFSWDKSILSWPTKLKLLWECNRIPIQFVVPLLQKLSALPENIAAKKKKSLISFCHRRVLLG